MSWRRRRLACRRLKLTVGIVQHIGNVCMLHASATPEMLTCTGADDSGRLHVAVDATFRHRLKDHRLVTDANQNPSSLQLTFQHCCNNATRTVWRLQVASCKSQPPSRRRRRQSGCSSHESGCILVL